MFQRMSTFRGGGSLLVKLLLRNPHSSTLQRCVVTSSEPQQNTQLSKHTLMIERDRRRRANISRSLKERMQRQVQKHKDINTIWNEIEEEKSCPIVLDDDRPLPRLSKFWRTQVMNMLSYPAEDIVSCVSNFELARSLYNHFLEHYDMFDSFQQLSICGNFIAHCVIYAPPAEKERLILDAYRRIKEQPIVLDRHFSEIVIRGLSHTKQWRKCGDIIHDAAGVIDLSTSHFSPYIRAALENADVDLAFKLIHRLDKKGLIPNDEIFTAFITLNNEAVLEQFLTLCHHQKWVPTKDSACKLMDWFESQHSKDWVGSFAVAERERCRGCGRPLQLTEDMSREEFAAIRDAMVRNTFAADQRYVHSTPEEVRAFSAFLQDHRPGWDVVVDGLNLGFAFLSGNRNLKRRAMAMKVEEVIRDLHERLGKRVCIIAKEHMQQWNLQAFQQLEKTVDIFYTRNDSDDDRFLLIAALSSSPHTMILSRDFFRQHSHPLPNRTQRELLLRWQRTHQIGIKIDLNGNFNYKIPAKHDVCIQRSGGSWHIPYLDGSTIIYSTGVNNSSASNRRQGKASYEAPNHWICLQQRGGERGSHH